MRGHGSTRSLDSARSLDSGKVSISVHRRRFGSCRTYLHRGRYQSKTVAVGMLQKPLRLPSKPANRRRRDAPSTCKLRSRSSQAFPWKPVAGREDTPPASRPVRAMADNPSLGIRYEPTLRGNHKSSEITKNGGGGRGPAVLAHVDVFARPRWALGQKMGTTHGGQSGWLPCLYE